MYVKNLVKSPLLFFVYYMQKTSTSILLCVYSIETLADDILMIRYNRQRASCRAGDVDLRLVSERPFPKHAHVGGTGVTGVLSKDNNGSAYIVTYTTSQTGSYDTTHQQRQRHRTAVDIASGSTRTEQRQGRACVLAFTIISDTLHTHHQHSPSYCLAIQVLQLYIHTCGATCAPST